MRILAHTAHRQPSVGKDSAAPDGALPIVATTEEAPPGVFDRLRQPTRRRGLVDCGYRTFSVPSKCDYY